jgi:F-type H+-transporting ATPase subunit b
MDLVTPDFGLAVWTTIAFLILMVLMSKFAWGPILDGVNKREQTIAEALSSAEKAKQEMVALKSDNDAILKEAREEQSKIIAEAREIKDKIIGEAKEAAQSEADKLVANAKENIENEKNAAMTEIKNHVATLSIDIAEKILKNQMDDAAKQKELVNTLIEDIKLN